MLNEILSEFEKVRNKDISTKNNIKDMIKDLKNELISLETEIEQSQIEMTVQIFLCYIYSKILSGF